MKPIIFSLIVSLSLLISAPAKADSYLALIDLTYAIGKAVVMGTAAGVMYVGGAAVKAVTPSDRSEKNAELPSPSNDASMATSANDDLKAESPESNL